MGERLDSRGNRVGKRALNGPGHRPLRNEDGLAPGLERTIENAANYLEGLVASHHAGARHRGSWNECDRDCYAWRAPAADLRRGFEQWTGRAIATRIGIASPQEGTTP